MKRLILLLLSAVLAPTLHGATTGPAPAELLQWKDWVLRSHPDAACPYIAGAGNDRRCFWPGTLELNINANGADFMQQWVVYGRGRVPLPGDPQHWPAQVENNGRAAAVLDSHNAPVLPLEAGPHRITGKFNWRQRPQFLQVPPETGLIALSIDGTPVPWPNLDGNGRLWFKAPAADQEGGARGDSVQVQVFRRIRDDIPIAMDTELRLVVSGKPRELVLGRLLLTDSTPVRFDSPLPARIEEHGMLRVQVRPGNWSLTLASRFTSNVARLSMERRSDAWPEQEIWSFVSNPLIRGVKLSGAPAVDPSQLDLPAGWSDLPTFLLNSAAGLVIEQQYRGDVSPTANQIKTARTLWLDFDGAGATLKDLVSGEMHQGWRLAVQPEMHLGRITIDGVPELVTRLDEDGGEGVEIRNGNLNVEAVSRVDDFSGLSASGWRHDVEALQIDLNIPPGWRLWHAGGPDSVRFSWLSRWDLWDLFLCLLIIGAVSRLFNWRWALLAAVTLALTYQEPGAPLWSWVAFILVLPLIKVLPVGRFRRLMIKLGYLSLAGLIIVILPFAVRQIQQALYPQLEQAAAPINITGGGHPAYLARIPAAPAPQEQADMAILERRKMASMEEITVTAQKKEPRYQPAANIQTGPGEPTWRWQQAALGWSGPVKADARLDLYLSPPWLTRLLKFIQVILTGLLAWVFARGLFQNIRSRPSPQGSAPAAGALPACLLLIAGAALFQPPPAGAQEYPPQFLLQELEQELTRAPECMPDCYAVNGAIISVSGDVLLIRLRIGAAAELAVPLPLDPTWQPRQAALDGMKEQGLARDRGRLWIRTPAGNHEIMLEGHINGDIVNMTFAQQPRNVSVNAAGWEIDGLVDNRVPSRSLQLRKQEQVNAQDTLLPAPVPPFVKVTRQVTMDLDWNVTTTITRMAPVEGGITVTLPLLAGESIVNEEVKLTELDGRPAVVATLAARQQSTSWDTVIQPGATLEFKASDSRQFVEEWSVEAAPRWHISHAGLLPVKAGNTAAGAIPRWLPWPGEEVRIHAIKPAPVPGPTVTVESIRIDAKPGARSTDVETALSIRSSLGGDFRIRKPAGAELNRIAIDGSNTTKQQEDDSIIIPLHPGLQSVLLTWSLPTGIAFRTSTPDFKLSSPAHNIDLSLSIPPSRWPLLVTGPDFGPAMLYWGILAVMLLVAAILDRVQHRYGLSVPVNTWQWMLLGAGMSTVNMAGSIPVVLWFFIMEARTRLAMPQLRWKFNLIQVLLWFLSLTAVACLFATIPESLLSTPDMKVTGNGSYNYFYQWYQDHSGEQLPAGNLYSVSIWVYRIAMLAWSLWIVFALLRWSRWGWHCISKDRLWKGKIVEQTKPE